MISILCLASEASAQDFSWSGHAKYQLTDNDFRSEAINSALGPSRYESHGLDLRLNTEFKNEGFSAVVQGETLGVGGSGVRADRTINQAADQPLQLGQRINDDRRLFNLTTEVLNGDDGRAVMRLDRAFVSYASQQAVLQLGRQAVTWGNGLVFSAIDFFNPFSPTEIDKDYKTGDDLLWGQWLFANGADIQALIIPRRDLDTDSIEADSSSFAVKGKFRSEAVESDFDLLAARHYGENTFAAGVSRVLLDAVLRTDIAVTNIEDGPQTVFMVANVDRSWALFGKNMYGYLEYYRNGVGRGDGDYSQLSNDLTDRISRGELFTLGRDYLTIGCRIEWMPLLNSYASNIFNLHDESGVGQIRFELEPTQDWLITLGTNLPYGARQSEFGGISLPGSELLVAPATTIYLRLSYFF